MNKLKEGDEIIALKTVLIHGDTKRTPRTTIGKSYKVVEVWNIGMDNYDFKIVDNTGYKLQLSKYYVDSTSKYCCFKVLNWERVEKIKTLME